MQLKQIRNIFLMFMTCALLGWIYEVLVGIFETHMGYVNRGLLFGPYLPIVLLNYIDCTVTADKK